jgi:hypothetical protein
MTTTTIAKPDAKTTTTRKAATRSSRWTDRIDGGDRAHITEEVNEYGAALCLA